MSYCVCRIFETYPHSSSIGFECTPAYIEEIAPTAYGPALRNLLYGALLLNAPLMLFVYAILPETEILSGANVLSILAEKVGGRWLRIIILVDAILVLAGGVLTGIFTVCGLLERLARYVLGPQDRQFLVLMNVWQLQGPTPSASISSSTTYHKCALCRARSIYHVDHHSLRFLRLFISYSIVAILDFISLHHGSGELKIPIDYSVGCSA